MQRRSRFSRTPANDTGRRPVAWPRLSAHAPDSPRRRFLLQVLEDVDAGAYSVLEHRYLTGVERPHGLPTGNRQRRVRAGRTSSYRDVEYLGLRTVVELDGRLGHERTAERWDDMDRDLETARDGTTTVRVGWRHTEDPCRMAEAIAAILQLNGWTGSPRPCSPACPLTAVHGDSQASGA